MSWNSLPNSLRESACDDNISDDCFKHSLKTFLFSGYWGTERSRAVYDSALYKSTFTYLLTNDNHRLKWPYQVIKSGTNRKLVYDFLLVVYSNFCRITHRFWEISCETVQWPWNMPKVIDSCITWKLSCGHACKMFGRQWTNEAKIDIFNDPTLSSETPRISA